MTDLSVFLMVFGSIAVYCLVVGFVLALGKAAARADQEWDELEDAE